MTIAEEILRAVAALTSPNTTAVFSRKDIRIAGGIAHDAWKASYNPVFQGMREDEPGGAPDLISKHQNIFRRISYGKHTLTEHGLKVIEGIRRC